MRSYQCQTLVAYKKVRLVGKIVLISINTNLFIRIFQNILFDVSFVISPLIDQISYKTKKRTYSRYILRRKYVIFSLPYNTLIAAIIFSLIFGW